MLVSGVPNERVSRTSDSPLVLRNGQVALGKVNKIYPNNRAEVQVGGHRFIAQIETPLAVGERYIFQVDQKSDQLIHLRVIGQQVSEMSPENIASLLRQLNIRVTDTSVQFVQSLMNEQIPFNQKELVETLRLLDRVGNTQQVQAMVKQMLVQKMPLQEGHLRALLAVNHEQLSSTMTKAMQTLQSMPTSPQVTKLQSLLGSLVHSPVTEQLNALPQTTLRSFAQTLQLFNYIPSTTAAGQEFTAAHFEEGTQLRQEMITRLVQQLQQSTSQSSIRSSMSHFIQQYEPIYQQATNILRSFNLTSTTPMSNEQFTQLKTQITNHLLPHLPPTEQEVVRTLLATNTQQNVTQLHALLQTFSSNQFYSTVMEALANDKEAPISRMGNAHPDIMPQKFMLHIKQVLQTLGLSHESTLKNLPSQQMAMPFEFLQMNETVKSMLLNVMQEERAPLENIQQLVHHINGLQLQTREESNLMHAQLQLPGEKIGLPEDLFIQFEGRKTKDDQIDTEFCRILFFLDLHHIKETIIDMNVQKRVITLTVYNEYNDRLATQVQPFKQLLIDGLEKLDYRLSNVRFKPLEDEVKANHEVQRNTHYQQATSTSQEGFDLRI